MSSEIKVSSVKAKDGTAGISIADSTGRVSFSETNPTITLGSNATFPTKVTDRTHWYQLFQHNAHPNGYGRYQATANAANHTAQIAGCCPTGYNSVVSGYVWFITANSGGQTYTGTLEWSIASSQNSINQHYMSTTACYSITSNPDQLIRRSITGVGSSGSRFEDLIAEGDAFGMSIASSSTSYDMRFLGVEITWRIS